VDSSTDVAARIHTVGQLLSIVQAMRTLAAARVRQAQEKFAGLERYAEATKGALSYALAVLDAEGAPTRSSSSAAVAALGANRVVVLFSEHGFVGGLNERLLEVAERQAKENDAELMAVGQRGLRMCRERHVEVTELGPMPATPTAATATAQRLVADLFGAVARGVVATLDLVFPKHVPPMRWTPEVARLFPPEVTAEKISARAEPPIHTMAPSVLVAHAIEEYAFAQIAWAVAETFASESAARLVAMDTSRRHIDDKLSELRRLEHATRQELITNEILEIAAGAETFREEA
jgi:F-type H+-transporting ATPase subunit gamma